MVEDIWQIGSQRLTSLNIKNETTHMLAERLARMTGETLTTAVTRALSERIARIEGPDFAC